jgi:hypothetical protein
MISLSFSQEEANEYAKLFVMNRMEFNMIPELDDNILKSIGIDKAGQSVWRVLLFSKYFFLFSRIRILRLQKNRSSRASAVVAGPVVNVNGIFCLENLLNLISCRLFDVRGIRM